MTDQDFTIEERFYTICVDFNVLPFMGRQQPSAKDMQQDMGALCRIHVERTITIGDENIQLFLNTTNIHGRIVEWCSSIFTYLFKTILSETVATEDGLEVERYFET